MYNQLQSNNPKNAVFIQGKSEAQWNKNTSS